MYHNKLFHCGFLTIFIALVVIGLSYHLQSARFITTARAIAEKMPAGDLSVVGRPSLPAATVNTILKDLGSPMTGTGQIVEQASRQTNIDDAFALAVWWTETNDGAAGVGLADRNPGSVRGSVGYPSAFDGYTIYPSYSAAIVYWFNMLKSIYVNRGLTTVYLISHPYVGTASSPLWAGKVVALMLKYRGEAQPLPIVSTHGRRGAGPAVYTHVIPLIFLHMQQVQSQMDKMRKNQSSLIVRQMDTTSTSPATTDAVVFFALLLALAIVMCVFWSEKRSDHKRVGVQAFTDIIRMEGKQDEKLHDWVMPGGDERSDGKLYPNSVRSVRPFRNITLYALQDANAPSTDALISAVQEVDTVKTDALVMLAEMNTGENFRIRGKIFLPSTPLNDLEKSGELTATSSLRVRSTGLLSRYNETLHQ